MAEAVGVPLIEDDAAVRIGSAQALDLAGFAVTAVESAERALEHIKAGMRAVLTVS